MTQAFSSIKVVESETCPGVKIHLKKLTEKRRLELKSKLRSFQMKLRTLAIRRDDLEKKLDVLQLEGNSEYEGIIDEMEDLADSMKPVWISWGVKEVEGLRVDEIPLTMTQLQEFPQELFNELYNLVQSETELSMKERKNSESPSTFGELEGLTQKPSTVKNAKSEDSGGAETAGSTSRTM